MHRSPRRNNVEIRANDPALTGHAGLLLTGELGARTNLVARLDRAIDAVRPFKQRRRGSSARELLVGLAEMMAVGGDHLVHLERRAVPGGGGQVGQGRRRRRQAQLAIDLLADTSVSLESRSSVTTMLGQVARAQLGGQDPSPFRPGHQPAIARDPIRLLA